MTGPKVLVLLGQWREQWPHPVAELLSRGSILIETVAGVHEAAARLVANAAPQTAPALLLDPAVLTRRDVELLGLMSRRLAITMLLLPVSEIPVERTRAREAAAFGALTWQDAAVALTTLIHEPAPEPAHEPAPVTADNEAPAITPDIPQNTMPDAPSVRYDEIGSERLVSDEELQALLGN